VKRVKGARRNGYAAVWVYESREAWLAVLFLGHGGPCELLMSLCAAVTDAAP
jgi:hypothetical protein